MVRNSDPGKRALIVELYLSRKYQTRQIAQHKRVALSVRRVTQILREEGVIRSRSEANRVAAALNPKHRIRLKQQD